MGRSQRGSGRIGAFRRRDECVMLSPTRATEEAYVRDLRILLTALAIGVSAMSAFAADGSKSMRLAQSSTTTNCMMSCNSQAASCQASCVLPSTSSSGTSGTNATASGACLSNCSSQQLACQTTCARISPSQ
jgi:hypothetical protein